MATDDITDPQWSKRVSVALWGNKETGAPGVVETVAKHERVLFGVPPEGLVGIIPALAALTKAFNELVARVDAMSDGKKMALTLLGLGVTAFGSLGGLLVSLATAYAVLTAGG